MERLVNDGHLPERWLLVQWPPGVDEPTDCWLADLPPTPPGQGRYRVEHDYRELKTGLGLDHFEGRTRLGWNRYATDGSILAGGGADARIRLWHLAGDNHLRAAGAPLVGSTGEVLALAFSPDGQTLFSGGGDSLLHLWNVSNPDIATPLGGPLRALNATVSSVDVSPSGNVVAISNRVTAMWNLDVSHAIRRVCQTTADALTEKVWSKYIPQLEFRPPCVGVS